MRSVWTNFLKSILNCTSALEKGLRRIRITNSANGADSAKEDAQ